MATCEMCGNIVNSTTTIKVAGTNMQACNNCKHMGKPVEIQQNPDYVHTFRKQNKQKKSEEVISNYTSILNSTLAKKGLNIHQLARSLNIKESTLNQYFSGKIKPDTQTAKKLERFLEITLTEEVKETNPEDYLTSDSKENDNNNEGLSLGEMLLKQMQKKK